MDELKKKDYEKVSGGTTTEILPEGSTGYYDILEALSGYGSDYGSGYDSGYGSGYGSSFGFGSGYGSSFGFGSGY